jgi:hypothetical protein
VARGLLVAGQAGGAAGRAVEQAVLEVEEEKKEKGISWAPCLDAIYGH